MLKTLLLLSIFISGNIFASTNSQEMVFSQEGYPYSNLIQKSEQVRILYSDKNGGIECRIEVINGQASWILNKQWVSKKKFDEQPLRSCVDRNEIKEILVTLYQAE